MYEVQIKEQKENMLERQGRAGCGRLMFEVRNADVILGAGGCCTTRGYKQGATCNWMEGPQETVIPVQVRDGEALSHHQSSEIRRTFNEIVQEEVKDDTRSSRLGG